MGYLAVSPQTRMLMGQLTTYGSIDEGQAISIIPYIIISLRPWRRGYDTEHLLTQATLGVQLTHEAYCCTLWAELASYACKGSKVSASTLEQAVAKAKG